MLLLLNLRVDWRLPPGHEVTQHRRPPPRQHGGLWLRLLLLGYQRGRLQLCARWLLLLPGGGGSSGSLHCMAAQLCSCNLGVLLRGS